MHLNGAACQCLSERKTMIDIQFKYGHKHLCFPFFMPYSQLSSRVDTGCPVSKNSQWIYSVKSCQGDCGSSSSSESVAFSDVVRDTEKEGAQILLRISSMYSTLLMSSTVVWPPTLLHNRVHNHTHMDVHKHTLAIALSISPFVLYLECCCPLVVLCWLQH